MQMYLNFACNFSNSSSFGMGMITDYESLHIMSAKDKKSEVFSCFKNVKGEFVTRSHTISLNKGLLNTSSHLC